MTEREMFEEWVSKNKRQLNQVNLHRYNTCNAYFPDEYENGMIELAWQA